MNAIKFAVLIDLLVIAAHGMALANCTQQMEQNRKEVKEMKKVIIVAAMLLIGAAMSVAPIMAQEVFLMKTEITSGYCHMKFPAITDSADRGAGYLNPKLEPQNTTDIVDFYGPCNYDPLGKTEVQNQKVDRWIAADDTDSD